MNPWPPRCDRGALPTELHPLRPAIVAARGGVPHFQLFNCPLKVLTVGSSADAYIRTVIDHTIGVEHMDLHLTLSDDAAAPCGEEGE